MSNPTERKATKKNDKKILSFFFVPRQADFRRSAPPTPTDSLNIARFFRVWSVQNCSSSACRLHNTDVLCTHYTIFLQKLSFARFSGKAKGKSCQSLYATVGKSFPEPFELCIFGSAQLNQKYKVLFPWRCYV